MKWFKHLSGSLNNSIISEAIERFGGDGYMVFFGILEMISDEFDIHNPGKLTLRMKKITKNLQLSRQKIVKILRFFDEKAKTNTAKDVSFFVDIQKHDVVINCKRLAALCDNHTQKLLKDALKLLQSENEVTSLQEGEVEAEGDLSNKAFSLPSLEEIKESSVLKIDEDINKLCDELYNQKIFPNVHIFKNQMLKQKKNKRALLHTLVRCYLKKEFESNSGAFGYCKKIIEVENGNYSERDYLKTTP